jgi:hypothetical protein
MAATFRFYEELNDFLAPGQRRRAFDVVCPRAATVKHMIESLGVPHTEVELVLVNGESVGFAHPVHNGDRVAVYPVFEALDVTPLLRVREQPLRTTRLLCDAHLGALARLLRMAGFDTAYGNTLTDARIARIASDEQRVVLTRDRDLLKRRAITHGCFVRALRPREQLREVFERLDLARGARPFTRCLACNTPLRALADHAVPPSVPETVRATAPRFSTCDTCRRVYWEGSHWRRMRSIIEPLVAGVPPPP